MATSQDLTVSAQNGTLVLSPTGLTCSSALLASKQRKRLEKEGLASITLPWESIKSWQAVSFPYYREIPWRWFTYLFRFGHWLDTYDWYEIALTQQPSSLGSTKLLVSRVALREDEQRIIEFAQPYLRFKFAPLQVTVKYAWPFLLAAAFAIVVLLLALSKCNLLDAECMTTHKLF